MISTSSYDLTCSTDIVPPSEVTLENNLNQSLITTNDIDLINEEKHRLPNEDHSSVSYPPVDLPIESSPSNLTKKHKSLISVYDNSNDGEQQQQQQLQKSPNSLPLVGILGHNQRAHAFAKRLLTSAFPNPILCDINSNTLDLDDPSNFVSHETFFHQSPSIILITENPTNCLENFVNLIKQPLLIDVRELKFSKKSSPRPLSIPECYQAFGNLSNWEIENGSQRVAVAIEQSSPINLIKFIQQLDSFPRGIYFVDQYTYNNEQIKSFRHCVFPFMSTIFVFSLCFILSLIEYRNHLDISTNTNFSYRLANSITGATSITLLSLLFLIRPLVEIIEFLHQKFTKSRTKNEFPWKFLQRWLQSRRYLAWYSLSFALLHILFLLLGKNGMNYNAFFLPIFFGVMTLIVLTILSFVYFPWISERLLWREYHLLTSYLGPFGILAAFIHVFIHWKYDYYYLTNQQNLFGLKFLSMFLPAIAVVLRLIIYGCIYPINQFIRYQRRKSKRSISSEKHTALLP